MLIAGTLPGVTAGLPVPALIAAAGLVGCVAGIYGIGGGSILSPLLIGSGRPAGRAGRYVRDLRRRGGHVHGAVGPSARRHPPAWATGIARGIGRLVGLLVIAIGARYLWSGLRVNER